MRTQKWFSRLGFGFLCFVTIAVLFISASYAAVARMFVYDLDFEIMAYILTPEQASHITRTVGTLMSITIRPLIATNLCWIIGFFVVYARMCFLRSSHRPNATLQPPAP